MASSLDERDGREELEELQRLREIKTASAEQLLKSRLGATFRSGLIGQIELDFNEEDVVVSFHCNYQELGLQPGVLISVTGSPKCLGAWEVTKSIPINEHGGLFIHVSKTLLPFEFKFIIRKDDRILWQKGQNFSIGNKLPDRFNIYVDMFMGEVTDANKKPITFNDYDWKHYSWALTNKNSCAVTIEADHMYLDPSCRMRRLLDKAMAALDKLLNPPKYNEDDLEPLRARLRALIARIDALQPLISNPQDLGALESVQKFVELASGQSPTGDASDNALKAAAGQAAALLERARGQMQEAPIGLRAIRTGCPADAVLGSTTGWSEIAWGHGPAGVPSTYVVLKDGVPVATISGTATSYRVEGLTVGATAALSVAVRTQFGPVAGPVCVTPSTEGPQLSAALCGPTSALLSWAPPERSSAPVVSYDVEVDGERVGSVEPFKIGSAPLSFTAHNLRPGATAVFRVSPTTRDGPGAPSARVPLYVGVGPMIKAGDADAPLGFRAVRVGSAPGALAGSHTGWVELAWSHGSGGAPAAYVVLKDGSPLAALGGRATSYRAEGLTVGATTALSLAVNSPQGPSAGPINVTPAAGDAPHLSAAMSGPTSAVLAWSPLATQPLAYDVEKDGEKIGSVEARRFHPSEPCTYTAGNLTPGATAIFRVVPVYKSGPGSPSAPVPLFAGVQPRAFPSDPSAPVGLCAVRVGCGTEGSEAPVGLRAVRVGARPSGGANGGWVDLAWGHSPSGAPPMYFVLKDGHQIATLPGTHTAFRAEGLPVGATSALSVAARSPFGAAAGPVHAHPSASGPQLAASLEGPTTALLTWSQPQSSAPVRSYYIEKDGAKVGSVDAGRPLAFSVPGLPPNSTATFRVVPVTERGLGAPSADVPLAIGSPAGSRSGWAELAWGHGAAGAPPTYVVLKDGVPVATLPGTATSYRVDGLAVGATAALAVAAKTPHGPSAGPVCATPGPDGPQLSGSMSGPTSAYLTWTAPERSAAPILSYTVEKDGEKVGSVDANRAGLLSYTAGGLKTGATAVFRVVPVTRSGPEPASHPVPLFAALQAAVPQSPQLLRAGSIDDPTLSPARPALGSLRRGSPGSPGDSFLSPSPDSAAERGRAIALSSEYRVLVRLVPGKEAELAVLESMVGNAQELARLRAEILALREREAQLLRELEAALADAGNASRIRDLEKELADLRALLAAKEKELEALRREIEALRAQKHALDARVADLQRANDAQRAEIEALKARIAALERELKGKEQDLLDVAAEVAAIRDASTGVSRDLDGMSERKVDVHGRVCICGRQPPPGGFGGHRQSPGSVNYYSGGRSATGGGY